MSRSEHRIGGAAKLARASLQSLVLCAAVLGLAPQSTSAQPAHDAGDGHSHGESPDRRILPEYFKGAPADLVSWATLEKAQVVRKTGKFKVTYMKPVLELNGKTVVLVGLITAVHDSKDHKQFLLTDRDILCVHCPPPTLTGTVEVNLKTPDKRLGIRKAAMIRGKLELIKDAPNGLIYRLNQATVLRRFS